MLLMMTFSFGAKLYDLFVEHGGGGFYRRSGYKKDMWTQCVNIIGWLALVATVLRIHNSANRSLA